MASPDAPTPSMPSTRGAHPDRLSLLTFNAGLAHGAVGFARERLPAIVGALAREQADVVCLQEVWDDRDFETLRRELADIYPHVLRRGVPGAHMEGAACTDLGAVLAAKVCVSTQCEPRGLPIGACVSTTGPCHARLRALGDDCALCLAANGDRPLACLAGKADRFVFDGSHGLALMSRLELEDTDFTAFDSELIRRGVLSAEVGGRRVHCTHLSSGLGALPYPRRGRHGSWDGEHAAEIDALVAMTSPGCSILLGDLNAGPPIGTSRPEREQRFRALTAAGYGSHWPDPMCTWCEDNPIGTGSRDRWIDHILFRGCGERVHYRRVLDGAFTIRTEDTDQTIRLSDHYGLEAVLIGD